MRGWNGSVRKARWSSELFQTSLPPGSLPAGKIRIRSNAVASAGAGGHTLIDLATAALIRQLPADCYVYHMGCHVLDGWSADDDGPQQVLLALPASLKCRLGLDNVALRSGKCVALGALDAPIPPPRDMLGTWLSPVLLGVQLSGLNTLMAWDQQQSRKAIKMLMQVVWEELQQWRGALSEDGLSDEGRAMAGSDLRMVATAAMTAEETGRLVAVFSTADNALRCAVELRQRLLMVDWDDELLAHEMCEQVRNSGAPRTPVSIDRRSVPLSRTECGSKSLRERSSCCSARRAGRRDGAHDVRAVRDGASRVRAARVPRPGLSDAVANLGDESSGRGRRYRRSGRSCIRLRAAPGTPHAHRRELSQPGAARAERRLANPQSALLVAAAGGGGPKDAAVEHGAHEQPRQPAKAIVLVPVGRGPGAAAPWPRWTSHATPLWPLGHRPWTPRASAQQRRAAHGCARRAVRQRRPPRRPALPSWGEQPARERRAAAGAARARAQRLGQHHMAR